MKWAVELGPDDLEAALDRELEKVVGVGHFEYRRAMSVTGNMPMRMFNALVRLVDESGVIEKLAEWDQERRKANTGRKPFFSFRAVLVIELMTVLWNRGVQYQEIGATIAHRLTTMQCHALGFKRDKVPESTWVQRHWRAKKRLLTLIDPYYLTPKNKRLPLEDALKALANTDQERERRLQWVIQALVDASVSRLPQRYHNAYSGDVSLDSTRIKIQGRVHSRAFTLTRGGTPLDDPEVIAARRTLLPGGRLTNADFTAGTYQRRGIIEPAHELDFVTMMDAAGYDEHPAFARLITAVAIHRPSEITNGPRLAMQAHSRTFTQRGLMAADRAFNGSDPVNLQLPLRRDYWEMAFDYKKSEFGLQGTVPGRDIIVVDGALYVDRMPDRLKDGVNWYKNDTPDPVTGELLTWNDVENIIEERRAYQMKRHGSIKSEGKNGAQRFTYPDPSNYRAFDPATGKPIPAHKNRLRGSVLIHPHESFVKHLQRYPWGTPEWATAYGQRNQVESSNSDVKRSRFVDIEDPQKRSGRGMAFHGLASALMVLAHNIRKLVSALVEEHTPTTSKNRKTPRANIERPNWTLSGAELDAAEPPGEEDAAA